MPASADPLVTEAAEAAAEPVAMGFFEHLAELRRRILTCVIAVAVTCLLGLAFWEEVYAVISTPILRVLAEQGLEQRLLFTSPLAPIRFALQVGLYAGIFLAAPVIFWQVWLFVAPGLYRHERRFVLPFVLSSSGLFLLGAYFAHRVVLPLTLTFLLTFGREFFQPIITINEYFSLWLTLVLWMGVIFEMPVLVFILSWIGVVTPGFLLHYFRHAVLAIVILAAVITPTTDAFTMAVFAAPMIGLYVLSIGLSYLVQLRRRGGAA
jgi:sec-independent protein translocase protein TatC